MSPDELAAIVARDAEWVEQDGRLVYTWINVRSGEKRVAPHATDPDGPADRRALLALLRETRAALAELHHGADCTCPYSIEPADLAAAEYRMSALAALGPP